MWQRNRAVARTGSALVIRGQAQASEEDVTLIANQIEVIDLVMGHTLRSPKLTTTRSSSEHDSSRR